MASEVAPREESAKDGGAEYKPLRLEHTKLNNESGGDYRHSFLTDVSGKNLRFEGVNFSYSVLSRGYFHNAIFVKCKFVGARFSDCNFRNASFLQCDFRYADFLGTRIPTDAILSSLPDEPNIRRELLQILRKNAISLGDVGASRRFVLAEIDAKKEHLRRAWKQDGQYYKHKYSGTRKRLSIGLSRVGFWLDSFLWGHGERLWKLVISVGVLIAAAAAISTVHWLYDRADPKVSSLGIVFYKMVVYYANVFLDVQPEHPVERIVWLDWIIVLARYTAFGVLVAGLFRWLSHR